MSCVSFAIQGKGLAYELSCPYLVNSTKAGFWWKYKWGRWKKFKGGAAV
jgi:hypothetical protein